VVQTKGGFQNSFLFAEHGPSTTSHMWNSLEKRQLANLDRSSEGGGGGRGGVERGGRELCSKRLGDCDEETP